MKKGDVVKIAFSVRGNVLESPLDERFGRASGFLIYDEETGTFTIVDNAKNLNADQGAGIQSAENVIRTGAKALVTGHCGPKAFRVLSAAGVSVYNADAPSVAEALDRFRSGRLKIISEADVDGHW